MRLGAAGHLTYCSNIHPGETWAEVQANLQRHVPAVRQGLGAEGDFGIGLRLSARAAEELAQPGAMAEFQAFLARERLYVFTLNGFPYGTFHGTRVKEGVYQPDWRDPERLRYTNRLADLLAALLPDEPGLEGSVSTVPGAFKPALSGEGDAALMAGRLVEHAAHLVALRQRSGRTITLALEPEPHCFLETVAEAVAFFEQYLFGPAAVAALSARTGLGPVEARQALQRHLGLCLDLCHAAVEYEDAATALGQLDWAGIRVHKLQISAGLQLPALTPQALAALSRFDDPVYLHQVVARRAGTLQRFTDLPEAMASVDALAGEPDTQWRVHFHVPIFLDQLAEFESTQGFIREVLARHRERPLTQHLEVETYTWDVLPAAWRSGDVDAAIARELAWVREVLSA